MMFELLLDVDRFLNLRDANAEGAIALLPGKVSEVWKGLMNPGTEILPLSIERPPELQMVRLKNAAGRARDLEAVFRPPHDHRASIFSPLHYQIKPLRVHRASLSPSLFIRHKAILNGVIRSEQDSKIRKNHRAEPRRSAVHRSALIVWSLAFGVRSSEFCFLYSSVFSVRHLC